MAIASFLDVDAVSLNEVSNVHSVGQLREELAILKVQLRATREVLAKAGILDPSIYPRL